VVLAWSIVLLIVTAAISALPGHPAQANTSTASYDQATLTSESANARTAKAVHRPVVRWTVRPGDTLFGIAAALAVHGGWQSLYAANRQAIGPDPDLIRPGIILVAPHPAPSAAGRGQPGRTPAPMARPSRQATKTHEAPRPARPAPPERLPASSVSRTTPPAGMPEWLKDLLLVTGLLVATAFATEPVAALARRRRGPGEVRPHVVEGNSIRSQCAVTRANIVVADHERLVITYSTHDDTVYVLAPPGEDPQAVLRAARVILPEDTYEDLAAHLGIPSAWPLE
jgi:hypothetical protein